MKAYLSITVIFSLFASAAIAADSSADRTAEAEIPPREFWEEALRTADVFPGAAVEDFMNPKPCEDPAAAFPLFVPWQQVFSFPVNNRYSVGVVYNKNASERERYAVSAGDPGGQNQSIVYYDVDGKQTWGCYQQNSEGWGLRDLAYEEGRGENHGGGNRAYRRQVFLDDCSALCDVCLPEFLVQLGTAFEDGGSGPDSIWTHGFYSDFGVYSIDRSAYPEGIIDIKPQSCPNPLNVKSHGVLPVAILGGENLHVKDIDIQSIVFQGIRPIRSAIEDVATPVRTNMSYDRVVIPGRVGLDVATDHSCVFDWVGFLMSDSDRGAKYGIAIDETGVTGEPWVLWVSYQDGPGGNRLEARRRDGSVIGYQALPGFAGGLDFTDDWEGTGKPALIYLQQYAPDCVHVFQAETATENSLTPPPVAAQKPCECTTEGPDGYDDLVLKFRTQEIVEALGEVSDRDTLLLTLTFTLMDGTELEGSDCIIIVKGMQDKSPEAGLQLGAEEHRGPKVFALFQNCPNPVTNSTALRYTLPKECHVTLEIFHVTGHKVSTVVDGNKKAGNHSVLMTTENLPAGVYFYRLITKDYLSTGKMVVVE